MSETKLFCLSNQNLSRNLILTILSVKDVSWPILKAAHCNHLEHMEHTCLSIVSELFKKKCIS